jgi:hypothetical protein
VLTHKVNPNFSRWSGRTRSLNDFISKLHRAPRQTIYLRHGPPIHTTTTMTAESENPTPEKGEQDPWDKNTRQKFETCVRSVDRTRTSANAEGRDRADRGPKTASPRASSTIRVKRQRRGAINACSATAVTSPCAANTSSAYLRSDLLPF